MGTTLIVGGLMGCAICYVAAGVALRRGKACPDVYAAPESEPALTAQCAADALLWTDIAITGFIIALVVAFVGVVIDRIQGWMRTASRRRDLIE